MRRASSAAIRRAEVATVGRIAARRAVRDAAHDATVRAPSSSYHHLVRLLAADCHSVLDIGTGLMRSLQAMPCRVKVGLEAHRPYLEHREVEGAVPINASALDVERLFVPGAVDLVTLIDVLEHFSPEDSVEVLRQVETVARRRVVLFAPRGSFPQEGHDPFALGGEDLQRHRSTWEPEDLVELGYRVAILSDFHDVRNSSFVKAFGQHAPPVDALLAWKAAEC
jgi:hypothetical protein